MLNRIHIKRYKSISDVEVRLSALSVLFGPNAAGKSNFLDALQLLSKLATSKTIKEAFDPPYRGKPLESFSFGQGGIRGLVEQERLSFSIEADLRLSNAVVDTVNRQIREMRRPSDEIAAGQTSKSLAQVRERDLRYRIEIEMLPRSGILRVTDEYLAALNLEGEPTGKRRPFIERQGQKIHLRLEGQAHPTYYERYLDHTILSMPHYPPHYPHLVAARRELESWLFFYFEPRERMRAANPVKEVRHIGLMGEDLAAFLNTLKALDPKQFQAVEKALHTVMPNIDGIEVDVSSLGEVELRLQESGVAIPARVLSEGTLRILGLLALAGVKDAPALVGFEEPENGIHPRRIQLIAELLRTRSSLGLTQYIVTTHSPILPDLLPNDTLFVVRRINAETQIDPFSAWGPLARKDGIGQALDDSHVSRLSVSERMLRGDFDA
jgi:predicted ATPase